MDESELELHNAHHSWRTEEEAAKERPVNELNESSQGDTAVAPATVEGDDKVLLVLNKDGTSMDDCSHIPTAQLLPQLQGGSGPPRPPAQPRVQTRNAVSDVKLGCTPDLHFITESAWNLRFKPQAHDLLTRICKPRTAARISKSRTINCRGAKSEAESQLVARRYARKLQRLGFSGGFTDPKVSSVTATGKIGAVDLGGLRSAQRDHCRCEPELNRRLYYTGTSDVDGKTLSSGGVGFVRAKTKVQAYRVFSGICSMLRRFRRP